MKLIYRLSLLLIAALVAIPLVIMAQDQPTPSGSDDDLFVPIPTQHTNVDDLFVPLPTQETNLDDLFVPLPTQETNLDDIFVPIETIEGEDLFVPLPEPDTCGNDDPNTIFVPLCPPTRTPAPTRTPRPTVQAPTVVNGLWVLEPGSSGFSSSGSCSSPNNNDNGGPDRETSGDDEPPTVPVCMTTDQQWLTVASLGTYPLTVAPFYSQQQMKRELLETNGKTTGSVNVSYTRQYQVISPTEIEYSYIYSEAGGCTTKNTFRYKLKDVNDLVCTGTVMTPEATYTPTSTPIPTAMPGETQQPPVTPQPPVKEGRYIITLPPNNTKCTAEKMPPSDVMDMSYDNNQNMSINFGGSSYTLYWDGGNFYRYRDGNKFSISLYASATQTNFTWRNQECRIDSDLFQEGAPTPTSTPTPVPVQPTAQGNTDTAAIAGNSFTTSFDAQEALCATENRDMLPDLSSAILSAQADDSFVFTLNGIDYILANQNGYYMFTKFNDDGSMLMISLNGFDDGKGIGTYSVISAAQKMCTAMLTFTPAG